MIFPRETQQFLRKGLRRSNIPSADKSTQYRYIYRFPSEIVFLKRARKVSIHRKNKIRHLFALGV